MIEFEGQAFEWETIECICRKQLQQGKVLGSKQEDPKEEERVDSRFRDESRGSSGQPKSSVVEEGHFKCNYAATIESLW